MTAEVVLDMAPIGPAHAGVLAGMHRICFAEPWDEKAMSALLAMPGAYGFLALSASASPQGFILCRNAGGEAEVLTFLVLPPFRRRGLASRLLSRAAAAANDTGATVLFLEVAADNHTARHLYSKHGFEEVGRRPRYYRNAVDALVMRRDLLGPEAGIKPS